MGTRRLEAVPMRAAMETMNLTETQWKVLREVDHWGPCIGPGWIGFQVFNDGLNRKPQHYARPGGKVLRALERLGLVKRENGGWSVSVKGRNLIEEDGR